MLSWFSNLFLRSKEQTGAREERVEIAEARSVFVRVERLETKVRELRDELADLSRSMKTMRLEWEEAYDKQLHLMARITKRAKVSKAAGDGPTDLEAAGDAETPDSPQPQRRPVLGSHSLLTQMRARHGLLPR